MIRVRGLAREKKLHSSCRSILDMKLAVRLAILCNSHNRESSFSQEDA